MSNKPPDPMVNCICSLLSGLFDSALSGNLQGMSDSPLPLTYDEVKDLGPEAQKALLDREAKIVQERLALHPEDAFARYHLQALVSLTSMIAVQTLQQQLAELSQVVVDLHRQVQELASRDS